MINQKTIKLSNYIKILQVIHMNKGLYRTQVAEKTHLAAQTVTNLVGDLCSLNYIKENPIITSKKGRTPIALSLNYSGFSIISIDIAVKGIVCFLNTLDEKIIDFKEINNNDNIIEQLIQTINYFISVNKNQLLSIVISVEGVVDENLGIILDSKDLNLTKVDLLESLRCCNLPIFIRNDVNLFAYCKNIEERHVKNCLVVKLDKGVGSSLIIDNHVVLNNNHAGELGHVSIYNNEERRVCKCGKTNCLTCFVSQPAIIETYGKNFDGLIKDLQSGDEKAIDTIKKVCDHLAPVLANICTLLDLDKIVMVGRTAVECKSVIDPYLLNTINENLSYWVTLDSLAIEKSASVYSLASKFFIDYCFNHFLDYKKMLENISKNK